MRTAEQILQAIRNVSVPPDIAPDKRKEYGERQALLVIAEAIGEAEISGANRAASPMQFASLEQTGPEQMSRKDYYVCAALTGLMARPNTILLARQIADCAEEVARHTLAKVDRAVVLPPAAPPTGTAAPLPIQPETTSNKP